LRGEPLWQNWEAAEAGSSILCDRMLRPVICCTVWIWLNKDFEDISARRGRNRAELKGCQSIVVNDRLSRDRQVPSII
jgi:hypothetical protein